MGHHCAGQLVHEESDEELEEFLKEILLMVQKSGDHHLR